MKVQCEICEKAVASVICCADEAALCNDCDSSIHAANKLANKHQRVPLINSQESPTCDICQEKSAFFFCLEDRALLCRLCDVNIHSTHALKTTHQRFLVPGTKVALEPLTCFPELVESLSQEALPGLLPATSPVITSPLNRSSMTELSLSKSAHSEPKTATDSGFPASREVAPLLPKSIANISSASHLSAAQLTYSSDSGRPGHVLLNPPSLKFVPEILSDTFPSWRVEEIRRVEEMLRLPPDFGGSYNVGEVMCPKVDSGTFGDYDWTAELFQDNLMQYAESFHEVPQMLSLPPTALLGRIGRLTGDAMKGKAKEDSVVPDFDGFIVPDIGIANDPQTPSVAKRRRQQFLQL